MIVYMGGEHWRTGESKDSFLIRRAVSHNTILERKTSKYLLWRNAVYERDNNLCVKCGAIGKVAHHILSFSAYPDKRYDIDNGITLCDNCHSLEHKWKGVVDNVKFKEGEK